MPSWTLTSLQHCDVGDLQPLQFTKLMFTVLASIVVTTGYFVLYRFLDATVLL